MALCREHMRLGRMFWVSGAAARQRGGLRALGRARRPPHRRSVAALCRVVVYLARAPARLTILLSCGYTRSCSARFPHQYCVVEWVRRGGGGAETAQSVLVAAATRARRRVFDLGPGADCTAHHASKNQSGIDLALLIPDLDADPGRRWYCASAKP